MNFHLQLNFTAGNSKEFYLLQKSGEWKSKRKSIFVACKNEMKLKKN
jgi:hypothetical protein